MAIFRVVCANADCLKILRLRAGQAGKRIRCPMCRMEMLAPQFDEDECEDETPGWMTVLFYLGVCTGVFLVVLAIAGIEIYLQIQALPANLGPTADALAGTWKVVKVESKVATDSPKPPLWCETGVIWTFHDNGKAE